VPKRARSFLEALELVSTLTPNRNNNIGHIVCSLQSKAHFKSNNFSTVFTEFLPREKDIQSIVSEMEEQFSDIDSSDLSSSGSNRAGMLIPNRNGDSRALQVEAVILPQKNTVMLLTVVIIEMKE